MIILNFGDFVSEYLKALRQTFSVGLLQIVGVIFVYSLVFFLLSFIEDKIFQSKHDNDVAQSVLHWLFSPILISSVVVVVKQGLPGLTEIRKFLPGLLALGVLWCLSHWLLVYLSSTTLSYFFGLRDSYSSLEDFAQDLGSVMMRGMVVGVIISAVNGIIMSFFITLFTLGTTILISGERGVLACLQLALSFIFTNILPLVVFWAVFAVFIVLIGFVVGLLTFGLGLIIFASLVFVSLAIFFSNLAEAII
ncbi:MAG: hypothetical protein NZO16_02990 [Deltaproteobacteria bacterium]|nr:hypothetical protein [Deltaproteobacteria bacterium]